jgi:uncharacterized protein YlzI (FlbEa/FlbD family)
MAVTKWSIGRNKQRPYAISLNESALSKETKMPRKATTALAALLVFGAASVVWADANSRTDGSFAQRPVSMVSNGRTGAVNDAAKSFTTEERDSFAASQLAPARGGTTGRMTAWIKLTEPGGKPIHINVEHVTSVRSDTQIPGARAQLDLTSGKFQAVQENVEQVMQLISATPGARENDETPNAAL